MGWRGEEWKGNACVARRSYSGIMMVSPLLFDGEGTLASPPFLCFQWQNPSRRGECGEEWLGGPSWSPVGWSGTRSPYIDKPNSPGDSQRTTIKAHQTPYLSS